MRYMKDCFKREFLLSTSTLIENLENWKNQFDREKSRFLGVESLINSNYQTLKVELEDLEKNIRKSFREGSSVKEQSVLKVFYNRLRVCYSMYAALLTCLNWQSPAVKSSLGTRKGLECEDVKADWNDYKRDRSSDAFKAEQYLRESIFECTTNDAVYLFNSGMAAFTTILYFLICEGIIENRKVLASREIYVESRMIVEKLLSKNIIFFSTNKSEEILGLIYEYKPSVVFIEPLSNTGDLRLFDVKEIIKNVNNNYKEEIYFVIDTTCSFCSFDFLNQLSISKNVKIITHGSMLKAPQLGLERVNSGFIYGINLGEKSTMLLDYRTLSGTNIQDFATYLLPRTSRKLLKKRLKVIQANAEYLGKRVESLFGKIPILKEVVYPCLQSHPDYSLSKKSDFSGFFFNVKFVDNLNYDKYFEIYTREVLRLAKLRGSDIVHGASFGFNETSIYYSVGWDEPENHYIRISPGTEKRKQVEKIGNILVEALINIARDI